MRSGSHRLGSVIMFGRKQSPLPEETPALSADDADPRAPKGRPTPSRREAEAARKQQVKIPKDPKAAKAAAREREREDRSRSRAAMMAGDERQFTSRLCNLFDSRRVLI